MKKLWAALLLCLLILFIFYKNPPATTDRSQISASVPAPLEIPSRKPTATLGAAPQENLKKVPHLILSFIPSHAPSSLKTRWSHNIDFEDDEYFGSQLTLDGKPVNNFSFRWSKDASGNAKELVAGILPQVTSVKGNFPSAQEIERMVEDVAANNPADVLFREEVWSLSTNKILSPQIKLEVRTKSRSGRSGGHEIWMIDATTGDLVNRYDANRH